MASQLPEKIVRAALKDDFKQLFDRGYHMNIGSGSAADFVNTHFPNLNLLAWMQNVEDLLSAISTPPLDKHIVFKDGTNPEIRIIIHDHLWTDSNLGMGLERTIKKIDKKIIVTHDGFRIPGESRGKGVSKKVFAPSIQEYINMEIDHIMVDAGLTHGGVVWATYGFAATKKSDMKAILDKAEKMLSGTDFADVKAIFDSYYEKNEEGDRFNIIKWVDLEFMKPVLMGTHWEGILDFKNRTQLTNFISYAH